LLGGERLEHDVCCRAASLDLRDCRGRASGHEKIKILQLLRGRQGLGIGRDAWLTRFLRHFGRHSESAQADLERLRDLGAKGDRIALDGDVADREGDAGILPRLRNLKGGVQNEIEVRVTDSRQRLLSANDVPTVGGLGIRR
jgi:hypothetical protein